MMVNLASVCRWIRNIFSLHILCFIPLTVWATNDCQEITVHYNERAPYLITDGKNTTVRGLTADPVNMAFSSAGITYQWNKWPSERQMAILEEGKGCDCLAGWFKNAEREKFAKYTKPIYQDKPQVALTRADNKQLTSGMTINEAFADSRLHLLIKRGYSYGSYIDQRIQQHHENVHSVRYENIKMLELIYHDRFDYMFISPEEADGLIKASALPSIEFKIVTFADAPAGEKRYILCSQKVPDQVINRLNKAITSFH